MRSEALIRGLFENGIALDVLRCLHFEPLLFFYRLPVRVHLDLRWACLEFGEFPKKDSKQSRTRGQLVAIWKRLGAGTIRAFTGPVNYHAMFLQNVWLLIHR
ncbi:hypothetical protein [Nitrobacter sp. TKz-YC02]|uniref:hypothetical protein n=1 Tax=Nitrobacter sp. TKz-YC02 TaxID=3398704 RepID=UPI003CF6677F